MSHIQVYTEKRRTGRLGLRRRTQYRWRIVAANNRIIATGGEGYNNLADLWSAIRNIADTLNSGLTRPIPIHEGKPTDA